MDNQQVGQRTAQHIAEIGITRAYFVSTPDTVQPIAERRIGLHNAATTHHVNVTDVTTAGLASNTAAPPQPASFPNSDTHPSRSPASPPSSPSESSKSSEPTPSSVSRTTSRSLAWTGTTTANALTGSV